MRYARLLLVLVPGMGLAGEASAQDRLSRTFAHEHGLAGPPVWAVAQDSSGFLWVGAEAGLYRFDGTRMRRWAEDTVQDAVMEIATSAGRVVAVARSGRAFEMTPSGAVELAPPPSMPRFRGTVGSAAFDADGGLWLLGMESVVRLGPDGRASTLGTADFAGQRLRIIASTAFGGTLVVTDSALWRVGEDSLPRRLFAGSVIGVDEPEPGRILVLFEDAPRGAAVMELRGGGARKLIAPGQMPDGRPIGLRDRGGTVFVALDRYLLVARPGERVEALGRDEGVESGGPLFVDWEGSLWLGSFVGLHQYPEPETRLWGERQGLPSRHTRFLARTGDAVWVMTWAGPGYLRQGADGWTAATATWDSRSNICMDARGGAWASTRGAVVGVRGTAVRRWPVVGTAHVEACTGARDGGTWLGTFGGLLHADAGGRGLRAVPAPGRADGDASAAGLPGTAVAALLHDSRDRLWIAAGSAICHASAAQILAAAGTAREAEIPPGTWQCTSPLTSGVVTGVVELPGGRLWMSSNQQGLFVLAGDEWRPHPLDEAPTRTIHSLTPSPHGGMWIAGAGILVRATERDDGTLQVLERPGPFHGLPVSSGSSVLDEDDGTLWVATDRGVFQIPAAARFARVTVPVTALVDARIDDRRVPLDAPLVLRHDRNRLELNFAALSFRDRSLLQHQVRLAPDEPWSMSAGEPSFRWVDLRPGEYQVEYRASLDGTNWSDEPIRFGFVVRPAWYATPWFLLVACALVALLAWGVYRARLAYLLGLERQRTRIAMDLHDEVGSGLASVGIMAGVLAADGLNAGIRHRTAVHIATAAEDLGNSLTDIVWSLDPRTATMEELATRLAEHGERMCAAESTSFAARFPEHWPSDRPGVTVRRNVLLIGLEALHNAARHGSARNVTLTLLPVGRREWELTIGDDGAGLPAAAERAAQGRGLRSMRRRAAEIDAQLTIVAARPSGTVVALRFAADPGSAARRMIMRVRGTR